MRSRVEAESRVLAHARRGYALAMSDPEYHAVVHERLSASLERGPTDLWHAIDWTWALALGQASLSGTFAEHVRSGAEILRLLMAGDDSAAARWPLATGDRLSLCSTLASHPFPDQAAWLLRKTSLAS